MVGFKRDDTLTANQKLIAGVLCGCITRFLTQPLDVIKLKSQLQRTRTKQSSDRVFKISRAIMRDDGPRAFWRGHNIGQIHTMLAVGSQFYIYELATTYAKELMESQYRQLTVFVCGCLAGCVATTIVVPLEVIRVRQMISKDQYKGLLRGAQEVYKTGGPGAFYSGLAASLIQMGPAVAISFTVFSATQDYILGKYATLKKNADGTMGDDHGHNTHSAGQITFASTIAGSVSGFVSKTLTYPFDLAKRRLQIETHEDKEFTLGTRKKKLIKCSNISQCLTQAYRNDGLFGLYKGWKVTIYKAQLTSVIAFTSYELICFVMRDLVKI